MKANLHQRLTPVKALVLAAACCALPVYAAPGIWVTGPSHRVLRTEAAPDSSVLLSAWRRNIQLYGARNEFVAFQVVLNGDAEHGTVTLAPLTGKGPDLDQVDIFREHFMRHDVVSRSGKKAPIRDSAWFDARRRKLKAEPEYPVQLVPVDAPLRGGRDPLVEGQNSVYWVDIFVPESQPPGTYSSTLVTPLGKLRVKLTVWDFTLPSVSHYPSWIAMSPEFIAWSFKRRHTELHGMQDIFQSYFTMAHNHRTCLSEGFVYGPDYAQAPDRRYLDHYTGEAFTGPFAPGFGFELLPAEAASHALIQERGLGHRAFAYLADEPSSKEAYEHVVARGTAIAKDTDGRLRRMVTEQFRPSASEWPNLDPVVDVFCPAGIGQAGVTEVEAAGNAAWTYNAGGVGSPYTDAPAAALRAQAWNAYLTGSRAWFFWHGVYVADKFNRYRTDARQLYGNPAQCRHEVWTNPLNFDEASKPWRDGKLYPEAYALRLNGDGLLFYPGQDVGVAGAIACIRLKNLRHGAQDFEYLYLLEKAGRAQDAREFAALMFPEAGPDAPRYETDPQAWARVRHRMGMILSRIGDDALRRHVRPYNQYPNPMGYPDYLDGKRF